MKMRRHGWRVCAGICLAAAIPIVGLGHEFPVTEGFGGPLTKSAVVDAPFSADASTTVLLTFHDGTTLEQSTTARYYRDRMGRSRVEFLMNGLKAATTLSERHIRTIVRPDPNSGSVRTLDAETRTVRQVPRSIIAAAAGGDWQFSVPIGGVRFLSFKRGRDLLANPFFMDPFSIVERQESLGSRRIADVDTIGSRLTTVIPPFHWHENEKPIELVDESWESPELQLLIAGHFTDSRTGEVDYRLANIRRIEPPPDLFVVPADYTADATFAGRNDAWFSEMRASGHPPKITRAR